MTCPLVYRLMQLVEVGGSVAVRLAVYHSADDRLLCHCDRMPISEDSSHGSGRGHDCICEAVRNLECELGIMPPHECLTCEAGQAIGEV